MKDHNNISFWKTPRVWFIDKKDTFLNQKEVYTLASIPSILVILSFVADVFGIFKIDGSLLSIILLVFLFIYGVINIVLVTAIQRSGVRLLRQKTTAEVMHKVVAENIREYLTYRKYRYDHKETISEKEIKDFISKILEAFYAQYLSVYYRKSVTVTLKYYKKGNLHSLRYGSNEYGRSPDIEPFDCSYVYQALSKTRKKLSYIYVKDILNTDSKEKEMLSGFESEIVARATGKYRTFIALPVRSGPLKTLSEPTFTTSPDLGLLGIDLKKPYGFGNLEENEIHVLLCLADLLSELVNDLIEK